MNKPFIGKFQGRLLSINGVKNKTGYRSTQSIYNLMNGAGFPRPIAVGARSKRWIEEEVDGWIEARIAESRQ